MRGHLIISAVLALKGHSLGVFALLVAFCYNVYDFNHPNNMGNTKYQRNIDELKTHASLWWPDFLSALESKTSVIPLLVKTQDDFISILKICKDSPEQVFSVLKASRFAANLFLKHLVVLTDFGGEQIQRMNANFDTIFPRAKSKSFYFEYAWKGKTYKYTFKRLPIKGTLSNSLLQIDGPRLKLPQPLDDIMHDMVMILLYAANSTNDIISDTLNKCEIGSLLGLSQELERYIKQKYIWVSRITGGAQSNTLGQVAQNYVSEFLSKNLGKAYKVNSPGHIPGIQHSDRNLTTFDIVVEKDKKYLAIEVSFQVTTNSVIERKAGQARARYEMIKKTKNYLGYVIDGAGNFQRRSAVGTICDHSDCTVAYSEDEFKTLIEFINKTL